jgi:hypothetical protein
MLHAFGWVVLAGPTGPAGTSVGTNGTFVVGASSTVNANSGSVVFVNDGAQFVDNRTTNTTFSLLGTEYMCVDEGAVVHVAEVTNVHKLCSIMHSSTHI